MMAQPIMDVARQAHAFLGNRQFFFFLVSCFQGGICCLQVFQQALRPAG